MITYYQLGSNGRLGNQIFQLMSTIGIARNNGYDYCFDFSHKDCFIHNVFDINSYACTSHSPNKIITEKTYHLDKYILNCPDNVCLMGYLQSHKYFNESRDNTKTRLKFLPKIKKSTLDRIQIKDYISIHVRRTDYLVKNIYEILNIDYYLKALEFTNPNYDIIVFSDDIVWCQQMFKSIHRNIRYCRLGTAQSLYTMTLCKEHIIANSTFSWWGAYLSNAETIVCPSKWFKDNQISDVDLIPPEWIRI